MKQFFRVASTGVLTLFMACPAFADMTREEAHARAQAALDSAHQSSKDDSKDERTKWMNAVDALMKSGVAAEKALGVVQAALAQRLSADQVAKQARQIESRAKGDKTAADKYADEFTASIDNRSDRRGDMRNDIASPAGRGAGGGFGVQGAGAGAGQGAGAGFGQGAGAR